MSELDVPTSRLTTAVWRVLDAAHRLTRPVMLGVTNVTARGPFMLVGNHQLLGMQDLPSLVRELETRRGVRVRGMGDHFHFQVPLWRDMLRGAGAVPGAREVYKRRGQRYELQWGERTGFARMAIAAGCPIVPFGAVGAEDRFDVLLDMDSRLAAPARALVRKVAGRDDVRDTARQRDRSAGAAAAGPALLPLRRTDIDGGLGRPRRRPRGASRMPRSRQGRGRGSHRGAARLPRGRPSPQSAASRQDHRPQRAACLMSSSATSATKHPS